MIVLLDRRNVKSFSLVAAENLQLHHLIETVQVQSGGERRQGFNAPVIGGENDVLNLQARRRRGTIRLDVDHDDTPALRQMQARRQVRGDLLRHCANFDAMDVPVFSQAVVNEIHHASRNGETQTFTAAALRQNESVDPEDEAIHIHQRTPTVAGIDGSIGLQVGKRLGGIRLTSERADHSHGD